MTRHSGSLRDRPEAEIRERLKLQEENLIRTAAALAEAFQYVNAGQEASPQVARSVQAAENRWRAIDREFGLLDSAVVAERLGASKANRNLAHSLAKKGRILGVRRGRRILYPGFQFDHDTGQVRPVIARVVELGRGSRWADAHLLQWFCAPNGFLGGARPVDVIDNEPELLEAARADMTARW